ncbi:MAG: OB-fold nucleic acid binding domain-containing protein [Candidatus Pacearchaeota archaeon]
MQTKTLFKLSLIVLLISLFLLAILSNSLEPKTIKIANINEKRLDEWVKVKGRTSEIKTIKTETGKMTLFKVVDETGSIEVVFYDSINITENVEVIGKVTEYKNKIQLQATKIKNL